MENNLFHRKLDFTDDFDRLLQELSSDTKQPPPQTFEEFLCNCEMKESADRLYLPDKKQFAKAAILYRHARSFAKQLYANVDLTVKTDGTLTMTIRTDYPMILSFHDPAVNDLLHAIQTSDHLCITPTEPCCLSLAFGIQLYQVTLLSTK